MQYLFNLPFSRELEREADDVGLHLMAKVCIIGFTSSTGGRECTLRNAYRTRVMYFLQGCFDVREASNFWLLIKTLNVVAEEESVAEFASTHPSEESRFKRLDSLTDEVLERFKTTSNGNLFFYFCFLRR